VCDGQTHYDASLLSNRDHSACTAALKQQYMTGQRNSTIPGQVPIQFSNNFFGPFKNQEMFNRCGPNSKDDFSSWEVRMIPIN
jgi:hypothetical protein